MTPPNITAAQRREGLARALAARSARARLKQDLRSGRIVGQDVLRIAGTDTELGRAAAKLRIGEVLLSLPGVGPARADQVLVAAGISGHRRVTALGPRQREKLADVLS